MKKTLRTTVSDALSGSPIEICVSFVVFDGERNFSQIDQLPVVQQNA